MSATSRVGRDILVVLAFKSAADVLDAGQREAVQRVRDCLQVSLRQMQILSGSLQVTMTEQNLDGAQVGAAFQQMCRPAMTQRVRSNAFAEPSMASRFLAGEPHTFVRDGLFRSAPRIAAGEQ